MDTTYKTILKERIENYGIDTLMDEEAISALTGIPVDECKKCIDEYGLPELIKYTQSMNITKGQRKKLEMLFDFAKRLNASAFKDRVLFKSASSAGDFFISQLQFQSNEIFLIALLNSQNRLIKTEVISKGTINEAVVYPRKIVKCALDNNANSVILAHNHPGGTASPSSQDMDVTKKICAALKTINISVLDHIIVAENRSISFAEKGLLNFS